MLSSTIRKKGMVVAILIAVITTSSFVSIKTFAESNYSKKITKPKVTITQSVTKPDTAINKDEGKVTSENYSKGLDEYIKNNNEKIDKNNPGKTFEILKGFMKGNNIDHLTTYVN